MGQSPSLVLSGCLNKISSCNSADLSCTLVHVVVYALSDNYRFNIEQDRNRYIPSI
jgi:hypothetical protein